MAGLWTLLRFLVGFVFVALVSTLFFVLALLLLPSRVWRIRLTNVYGKTVGPFITWLAGVRPIIHHRERLNGSMPAIYVANHTSTLDLFLCIWLCPFDGCGVMKKEIRVVPFFGWLAVLSGHLLIDRGNKERAVEALARTAAFMRKHSLGAWMMPEGTRSRDGRLLPFKKGFVHLAIATGLPVVPVVLPGLHRTWQKGSMKLHSMECHIQVLPPIDTSGWKEESAALHAEQVRQAIASVLPAEQRPV